MYLSFLYPNLQTIRNVALVTEEIDALGLRPTKKMDQGMCFLFLGSIFFYRTFPRCLKITSKLPIPAGLLERQFGTATSGNLRMENFDPKFYLLENYFDATYVPLLLSGM